jgi:hypothetical protein
MLRELKDSDVGSGYDEGYDEEYGEEEYSGFFEDEYFDPYGFGAYCGRRMCAFDDEEYYDEDEDDYYEDDMTDGCADDY